MAPPTVEALAAQLRSIYATAWAHVQAEADAVAANPAYYARGARLAEVQRRIETYMATVDEQAAIWVSGTFPGIYGAGAAAVGVTEFTQAMRDAVSVMAQGLFDDLLAASRGVEDSAKTFLRQTVAEAAQAVVVAGESPAAAAREARGTLGARISAVTYKDGAQVGLDTYTDMALRTTTGIAYNRGLLEGAFGRGFEFFEVIDGPFCGWTDHDDGDRAAGTVRPRDECEAYPLSHPNCRRSFFPRPDVKDQASADAISQGARAVNATEAETASAAAARQFVTETGRTPAATIVDERALKLANRAARIAARSPATADEVAARLVGEAARYRDSTMGYLDALSRRLGGEMVGTAKALKEVGSVAEGDGLADKIARDLAARPILANATIAGARIGDTLRFTMSFDSADYWGGVAEAMRSLGADGYRVVKYKDFWDTGQLYRGLNVQLANADGQLFELQFHTPESFATKGLTHTDYGALRVLERRVLTGELSPEQARLLGAEHEARIKPLVARLVTPPRV